IAIVAALAMGQGVSTPGGMCADKTLGIICIHGLWVAKTSGLVWQPKLESEWSAIVLGAVSGNRSPGDPLSVHRKGHGPGRCAGAGKHYGLALGLCHRCARRQRPNADLVVVAAAGGGELAIGRDRGGDHNIVVMSRLLEAVA